MIDDADDISISLVDNHKSNSCYTLVLGDWTRQELSQYGVKGPVSWCYLAKWEVFWKDFPANKIDHQARRILECLLQARSIEEVDQILIKATDYKDQDQEKVRCIINHVIEYIARAAHFLGERVPRCIVVWSS